jgi:hypothetical protein
LVEFIIVLEFIEGFSNPAKRIFMGDSHGPAAINGHENWERTVPELRTQESGVTDSGLFLVISKKNIREKEVCSNEQRNVDQQLRAPYAA